MGSTLITDARIVNEGLVAEGDVYIRDARIEAVGGDLAGRGADEVIEAKGQWLLPGLIDGQVHFREPGLEHKGDLASESAAAVAGGVTSFFEMPNTRPPTVSRAALEDKYARAAGRCRANYAFFLGATHYNIDEIEAIDPRTTPGVKVFMGASTGELLVDEPAALEAIFARSPVPVATHCEDTPTIRANEQALRERYGDALDPACHPRIRTVEACWRSSSLAVDLAHRYGTSLHVLHLSSARELALFEAGPVAGKRITTEACIHHLMFDDGDYAELGNRIKCNPAIKTAEDRAALLAALREDRIDIIATDHAPHTRAEKDTAYLEAPAGLPLIQDLLPALLELVHRGELSIEQVVEKTSHNVARRFDVAERGFVREGYWADLVLANGDRSTEVTAEGVHARCGWSPFEGRTLHGRVALTMVGGEVAYRDGEPSDAVAGRTLSFAR